MATLLKIEWWNDHDLGDILYQNGFKNKIYLDIEVEKPEYNTTIESDLNGDNVEIAKFRKEEKVYKFEMWGEEDLTDAFSFMQIHDNIEVTLQSGDVIQVAKHGLRADISWEEIGCLAKISVSFTENYIIAGNCDENMPLGCLCTDPGEFLSIEAYPGGLGAGDAGDVRLGWTVENIAGKKYTAKLYLLVKNGLVYTWTVMPDPEQYSCYENQDDSTIWIWDGQFWQLYPGYVISAVLAAGDITVTGWILPGTFCTVWYYTGAIWKSAGDYTADELDAGIVFTPDPAGTYIKLRVWNHSCDYDMTEQLAVT